MLQGAPPADSLRRALADVFARPEYVWVPRFSLGDWVREQWLRLLDWIGRQQTAHPAAFKVALAILIVVLVGLLIHMGYVVWRITRPTVHTPARAGGASGLRLEDGRAHRERADELARAGRYVEALAHRFVALLLELERRRALTVHPSKTPAEYVREARLDESGRASFADLVARLYRHVFGAVPCDAATYQDFGAAADAVFRHVAAA
ncbi:MAG: hypothetical protein AUH06_04670 [Gemmatimonadetes bacterium 13_2_20CM_69_27]|nr:MAG: hypothetical protein AUH06_04670 [Gemmatimonadetes bacterium 13_2_20CM_69_27]OLB55843.1 MAG: hypothetical protein AUI13_09840 [Gemmatimonadetes bacterium 13_2_20CM_2_69_23]PYO33619.1 MAG: hypothetical protein DMD32_00135 [Gemmatimonadota bacterium]PYP28533.1 MAG: hypothetical protein DMD51_00235 [Gemmatimonadota bacterium]